MASIMVERSGSRRIGTNFEIVGGMTTTLNLALEEGGSSVEGYMLDAHGEPVAGHLNAAHQYGDLVDYTYFEIGDDGYYRIPSLPPGIISIRYWEDGPRSGSRNWRSTLVGTDESVELDLLLDGGAVVRCKVSNAPEGMEIYANLLHAGLEIPAEMNRIRWNLLGRFSYPEVVERGSLRLYGIAKGSYNLVVIAMPYGSSNVVEASSFEHVSVPIVVGDEAIVEVEVSF